MPDPMLIAGAELPGGVRADVRIRDGLIDALGSLSPRPGERRIDARGGALLPGLHDHHLHLHALAAARTSLPCGPPAVNDAGDLAEALGACARHAAGWIRGVGYHDSVAGTLDRHWLDRHVPALPVRIQHRSGRLWIFNSAGLERLADAAAAKGLDLPGGSEDGRLFDADPLVRAALGTSPPDLSAISRALAASGVTGVTDMSPDNDPEAFASLIAAQTRGELRQRLLVAGSPALDAVPETPLAAVGPTKFHLHEADLPSFDKLCATLASSHRRARTAALHCVTETELVFALAALEAAGVMAGDRIEHASVTPDALLERIRDLGLVVVTQPNFVLERGDAYLEEVPAADHPHLYRARSFIDAGVPLAGGSDAPFGRPDPWLAMRAAVDRTTAGGCRLGEAEALSAEQALALFTGSAADPATPRRVCEGAPADLVLLCKPWRQARDQLDRTLVRMTLLAGAVTYDRGDSSGASMASTSPQASA